MHFQKLLSKSNILYTLIENLKYKYDDHESSLNNLSADISDLNKKIDDARISLMVGLPSRHSTYKN